MNELLDFLQKTETKKFIQENANTDVNKLLLNPPSQLSPFAKQVAGQILARQKGKGKIDSWVSNFGLIFPAPLSIEQASSEKTAAYKKLILKGQHLIDLTGGMGIDTLALGENFERTTYVEQQVELAQIFKQNCLVLGRQIEVVSEEAKSFLEQQTSSKRQQISFFIDPARRDDVKKKVFKLEDCSPNIIELLPLLQEKGVRVLIKLSPFLDIKLILEKIRHVKEVHVVSIKNDCKEILVLVDFSFEGDPQIKTVNLGNDRQTYNFTFPEEQASKSHLAVPKKYLLEPNASILKAGAFNKVALDFGVYKLHPNTHLYTSENQICGWPGRTFEVLERKTPKNILNTYAADGLINVLTRNYPMTPAALKKKFKVKDGGEFFLIGFLGYDKKNHLVISKRIKESNC
ncbi:MAG: class I SAM-dependent methyltransferase [Cyclobacteriaceae bacterium]